MAAGFCFVCFLVTPINQFLIMSRLRTIQNLATELDLAIVAKRSFKIVYISYIYHNKKTR